MNDSTISLSMIAPEAIGARSKRDSLRSSLRSSLATLLEDCPICLDAMRPEDLGHILQCERHCGFNMCKNCIGSLITSSKDDFQMASDGNLHVKVYLHCPNCRSDLSQSIRHTLLLRKVSEVRFLKTPESEWTSSQVRLKNAMHTTEVQKAIKHARIVEAEHFGEDAIDEEEDEDYFSSNNDSKMESYVEQWGVEADLSHGVHDSFVAPRPPAQTVREEVIRVDPTLFSGLDEVLTEDEREEVTKLMTRGKPIFLVRAAEILYNALQKLYNPQVQRLQPLFDPQKLRETSMDRKKSWRRRSIARRSSVFQLIADAEAAEQNRLDREEKKVYKELQALQNQNPRSRIAQHRQLERELRIQADFQKRFPIPVRMPKAVKLDLSLPFDMELVDYTWGGKIQNKNTIGCWCAECAVAFFCNFNTYPSLLVSHRSLKLSLLLSIEQ